MGNNLNRKVNSIIEGGSFRKSFIKPFFTYKSPVRPKTGFINGLLKKGLIIKTGKGLYSYPSFFNKLIEYLDLNSKNYFNNLASEEVSFPVSIPSRVLEKVGYFSGPDSLIVYVFSPGKEGESSSSAKYKGEASSKTKKALLPAACIPWFCSLENKSFSGNVISVTTRNKVFRNEKFSSHIFKMNEFDLREFVFLGSDEDVREFLRLGLEISKNLIRECRVTFKLNCSSDLFFRNHCVEREFYQLFTGSKTEICAYSPDMEEYFPIGSINYHGNHFGKVFRIKFNGKWAYSGCIGFGLQRWALIFLNYHGLNKQYWPKL